MLNHQRRAVPLGVIILVVGLTCLGCLSIGGEQDFSGRYEPDREHMPTEFMVLNDTGSVDFHEGNPGYTWKRSGNRIIISYPGLEDAVLVIKGNKLYNPDDGTYFVKNK